MAEYRGLVPATFSKLNPVASVVVRARCLGWDQLRVLAFLDVATFHLLDLHLFGGMGLPTFLLLAVVLSARRSATPVADMAKRRFHRLIVPWLFWSMVFALLHVLRALFHGQQPLAWWSASMVWMGTESHLWFLPFAAALSLAAALSARGVMAASVPAALALSLGVATLTVACQPRPNIDAPWSQWAFSLPALPIGLGLARVLGYLDPRIAPLRRKAWAAALLFIAAIGLWVTAYGWLDPLHADVARRHGLAAVLLVVALLVPNMGEAATLWFEETLLGAYILHMEVTWEMAARVTSSPSLRAALGIALTLIVVTLLRRTPLRRVL